MCDTDLAVSVRSPLQHTIRRGAQTNAVLQIPVVVQAPSLSLSQLQLQMSPRSYGTHELYIEWYPAFILALSSLSYQGIYS